MKSVAKLHPLCLEGLERSTVSDWCRFGAVCSKQRICRTNSIHRGVWREVMTLYLSFSLQVEGVCNMGMTCASLSWQGFESHASAQ